MNKSDNPPEILIAGITPYFLERGVLSFALQAHSLKPCGFNISTAGKHPVSPSPFLKNIPIL